MKKLWVILFLCAAVFSHAQSREDMQIFIPMPSGGTSEEQRFFQSQFEMETAAAGYTVSDSRKQSDYSIELSIKDNVITYDDGTTGPPEADDPKKILVLQLMRNEDDAEIVSFEWPYDYMEDMLDYDLFLLYQAMANVPMTKMSAASSEYQHWRNKWVYIRASFDYPITFYALQSDGLYGGAAIYDGSITNPTVYQKLDHKISPLPAATFGLEFQFLNWMSAEADFNLSFSDPMSSSFIPAIQLALKFPIKPSTHFMIEPYGAASFPMNTSPEVVQFPTVGAGGGIQLGVRGGSMGAFFVDANFIWYFGNVIMKNADTMYPNPKEIHYNRFSVGFGIGYKVGFVNRIKEE